MEAMAVKNPELASEHGQKLTVPSQRIWERKDIAIESHHVCA